MLERIKRKVKNFHADTNGSEAIEMVSTTAMLICFIMIALMFLTYVMELNLVNTATKKVVRQIEVTGIAQNSRMTSTFNSMLGANAQLTNRNVSISNVTYHSSGAGHIQLKDTFRVTGTCVYNVKLINPGNFEGYTIRMPIKTTVSGISEVYWRS